MKRSARPLKVDYGFFVTWRIALEIYKATFFRLFAWAALFCAVPDWQRRDQPKWYLLRPVVDGGCTLKV